MYGYTYVAGQRQLETSPAAILGANVLGDGKDT